MQILYRKRIYPELFIVCGFRWNESYKQDLFSSRIDTTKTLAQAIAASPSPPCSWVLVSGVGESLRNDQKQSRHSFSFPAITSGIYFPLCIQLTACYKPSLTARYTEDSEWTPFDLLSKLVKEWEASALLPENVAKTTKQVIVRPGMLKLLHSVQLCEKVPAVCNAYQKGPAESSRLFSIALFLNCS